MNAAEGSATLDHLDSDVVEAVGLASEALEYVERARGHLYEFHQLTGHADLTFGRAAHALAMAGQTQAARLLESDVIGRDVLPGRWTFQVVDEFEDTYYRTVAQAVRTLERDLTEGRRHVFEARMKASRAAHRTGLIDVPAASAESDHPAGDTGGVSP